MKLRKDIRFYKFDENTYHMHDELSNKHFTIGREQKKWLELFDGNNSLQEIKHEIPDKYFNQFIDYVEKYGLLDNSTLNEISSNRFKTKIKVINIDNKLNKANYLWRIYSKILDNTFLLILLINIYLLIESRGVIYENINISMRIGISIIPIILTYILIFFTGVLHELSHAFVAKSYGIAVPNIGVMLFYLNPAFFVDLSGINMLKSKNEKIKVLAAGLKMNNILLFLSLVLLSVTKNSLVKFTIVLYIVSNIMIILINMIPYIEFDGYYIWSEILNSKNLKNTVLINVKNILNKQMHKVQIHFIIYHIYSIIFSSSFLTLGIIGIYNIINIVFALPEYIAYIMICIVLFINLNQERNALFIKEIKS